MKKMNKSIKFKIEVKKVFASTQYELNAIRELKNCFVSKASIWHCLNELKCAWIDYIWLWDTFKLLEISQIRNILASVRAIEARFRRNKSKNIRLFLSKTCSITQFMIIVRIEIWVNNMIIMLNHRNFYEIWNCSLIWMQKWINVWFRPSSMFVTFNTLFQFISWFSILPYQIAIISFIEWQHLLSYQRVFQ